MSYAGFWIRLLACLIDGVIFIVVGSVVMFATGFNPAKLAQASDPNAVAGMMAALVLADVVNFVLFILYDVLLTGSLGGTLGKRALGLRVVTAGGERVSYLRALGRFFAKIPSGMVCYIGFIMAAFMSEKRALHDLICSTRVVKG
jgi:uncharacterized RDD family membrane protein YckC